MTNFVDNSPNAGKLLSSLRSTGYSSYSAIADIIDNSFDANATKVDVFVNREKGDITISIVDDGEGMDYDTLDQALRLGSKTERNIETDLGRYGMGLVTASLSIGRCLRVLSGHNGDDYCSFGCQDIDEVIKQNAFVKTMQKLENKKHSGTRVQISKTDQLQNKHIPTFVSTLAGKLTRIYRHFLAAGKKITVRYEDGKKNGVIALDHTSEILFHPKTQIWSNEAYEITLNGKTGKLRIKLFLLPNFSTGVNRKLGINQANQGFSVLRNNREIAYGKSFGLFAKHNTMNRFRAELFYPAVFDEEMGLSFTKQTIEPNQQILDKIATELSGQIRSIRSKLEKEQVKSEDPLEHSDSESVIAQKARLLITPKAITEKRDPKKRKITVPHGPGKGEREPRKTKTSPRGIGAKFEEVSLGPTGPFVDFFQQGKVIVVQWNIDHAFYKEVLLENKNRKNIISAADYLAYAMAAAELKTTNDENYEMLQNLRGIISTNLRTLLS
jgi:hypothetical protein